MSAWMGQPRLRLPRFAEDAVERARLTVVPRRRPRAPRVPFMILVSMVLLAGVVGLLLFNTHMQQASFRATALEAEAQRLHATEQSLKMEIDELRNPQRVATHAQKLGMVPMVHPAFIRLSDGETLGNPVPASAADSQRLTALPPAKPKAFHVPPEKVLTGETPDTGADGVPTDIPGGGAGRTE